MSTEQKSFTVGDLKRLLADEDDSLLVILSGDGEGNTYRHWDGEVYDGPFWDQKNEELVGQEDEDRPLDREKLAKMYPACVVLYPNY